MTSRKAFVVSEIDKGPSSHGFVDDIGRLLFDTSPERTEIKFEGINCTSSEFLEWFLTLEEYEGRSDLIWGDDDTLIDIGGSPLDLSPGKKFEIEFDEYFNAFVENRIDVANKQIERGIENVLLKFDTTEDMPNSTVHEPCFNEWDEDISIENS